MQCQMCDRALGHNEAGYRVSMWQGHAGYKSFYAVGYICERCTKHPLD